VIAALPMYDREETRRATDRLWRAIAAGLRGRGIAAPGALTRDDDLWSLWRHPDLLLAQTCGLPYRARLHWQVTLVATPDYGVEGCPPGHYRSVVVTRAGEGVPAAPRLACNDSLSQSGWSAALDWAAAQGVIFRTVLETGGHAASARAVAEGRADLAAIDAVTWRLLTRAEPAVAALQVIDRTAPCPGLPLIAGPGRDAAPLAEAVEGAIAAIAAADRAALGLVGLARLPASAYLSLPIPPDPAAYVAGMGDPAA
jgi:ABC-type phosphate/phosphonate transport system substrate-binding protein